MKIEPRLGITKTFMGLNRRRSRKLRRARNSAVVEVKTPSIDQTSTKALAFLCEQSYVHSSNPFENDVSVDFTKCFNPNMTGIGVEPSLALSARDCDRYSKIAKPMKRHREREPSRLSVRRIIRSMKTRKARCKLKGIIRKSTPKSSRLYSLAADFKFWYVRYLNIQYCEKVMRAKCANFVLCPCELSTKFRSKIRASFRDVSSVISLKQREKIRRIFEPSAKNQKRNLLVVREIS